MRKVVEGAREAPLQSDSPLDAPMHQGGFLLSFWDAMIVQSAARLGCKQLLSEDLNHGQVYGEVQVINPFRGSD